VLGLPKVEHRKSHAGRKAKTAAEEAAAVEGVVEETTETAAPEA